MKKIGAQKNIIAGGSLDRAGFTLIEMMVAMTLFAVVVSIAMGGFVQALRSQRQITALMSANDAMSFTIEQIAREVRTGRFFSVDSSGSQLLFTNSKGEGVAYCYDAQDEVVKRAVVASGMATCSDAKTISAKEVVRVRSMRFILLVGDQYPPRVTILFSVSPKNEIGVADTIFRLQTTISGRNL